MMLAIVRRKAGDDAFAGLSHVLLAKARCRSYRYRGCWLLDRRCQQGVAPCS